MAMNPMQRKANNYLLIGVLVTLMITGTIIGFLAMRLIQFQNEKNAEDASKKAVYMLAEEIKSGDSITMEKLVSKKIPSSYIPTNSENVISQITETTIAKIDLKAGTILTPDMIVDSNEKTTDDLRKQEYNMLWLPSQIASGEYIDIRLRLPNGVDYIVVSKKKIEIPTVNGVDSENTIWINVNEAEIEVMSNAIVEAYIMPGALLYVSRYIEPGLQAVSTPTYVPSGVVQEQMYLNPNIEQEAKAALISRYNQTSSIRTNTIAGQLNQYTDSATSNVEAGVQEEINKAKTQRQNYLEALSSY